MSVTRVTPAPAVAAGYDSHLGIDRALLTVAFENPAIEQRPPELRKIRQSRPCNSSGSRDKPLRA
jgi:hypothetical protein